MRTFTAFVLDKHKYSIKDPILLYSGTKSVTRRTCSLLYSFVCFVFFSLSPSL